METENTQVDMMNPQEHPEMSDDETAAALGFITTLSEQIQNTGQEDDLEESEPEEEPKEEKQPEGRKGSIDDEQQAEIDDIRRELEALKNGNQPEPTPIEDTVPAPEA